MPTTRAGALTLGCTTAHMTSHSRLVSYSGSTTLGSGGRGDDVHS